MEKFKAILFDLDGTLLNTIEDLADSTNFALSEMGFKPHSIAEYRHIVGDGIVTQIKRSLPPDRQSPDIVEKCLQLTRSKYQQSWRYNTKPYPGIVKMLEELQSREIPMAVLSNKPDDLTRLMIAEMLPRIGFAVVEGAVDGFPLKPDPTAAVAIAVKMNLPAEQFVYLGDTATDMKTAVAAGMYPIGALWGFRGADELKVNGAKVLLEYPLQMLDII